MSLRMAAVPAILLLAAAIGLVPDAGAQERIVIYKCTDAAGQVTLQNDVACPAGTREERRSVDVPPALPAYVPREERMPAVVAAEQAREDARIDDAIAAPVPRALRKPPPPLFQCSTWDDARYFTEAAEPQTRCAPLQVVGIAGATPAASACEQVADTCAAVPEEALCRGWKQRVGEAEFRWKFAGPAGGEAMRLEYERLRATYDNSTCNPEPRG